ncbi:flagellar protein FlgN [Sphingomonas panacisoli]|uniref:Flagellar protein FlgN n=1 Tax=Sphingomonas panacisoli TaxID=1813879 RepID=A0A5B8LKP4_9SPHN|nr:flagellar protein FlgN [Sphingomonas panacisoli]QDZ08596.1 flagellar protein FlgN [Sphingomonas panacisoli]
MTRRDGLISVIDALHAEIAAMKSNDVAALDRATQTKLVAIDALAAIDNGPLEPGVRELAEEAQRLNETARIYVNLLAANVRRRLQSLAGDAGGYRPNGLAAAYA